MVTINQLYDRYYKNHKENDMLEAFWQGKANEVSRSFLVHYPIVRISNKSRRGIYWGVMKIIVIGENCWRGIDKAFYHEIAHHIVRERFGRVKSHGRQFKRILWDVVNKNYPNPKDYSWDNEYPSVKKYAEKKFAKLNQ